MKPVIILVDTNVLYHALDYGIHIQHELSKIILRNYKIMIHDKVEQEIISDLTVEGKRGRQAKLAMELIKEYEMYRDPREYEGTDIALIRTAQRINGVIFTFDKELRDRCKDEDVPVITTHVKGKLHLRGYID